MTSPALVVLFLAHVCSIFGTASEPAADHDYVAKTMETNNPNQWINIIKNLDETNSEIKQRVHDEIYTENEDFTKLNLNSMSLKKVDNTEVRNFDDKMTVKTRVKRDDSRCNTFMFSENKPYIMHPHDPKNKDAEYYNNTDCVTVISVPEGHIIELTFVDKFRIENHPECAYDYLEVRDGEHGYSDLLGHVCGEAFPRIMKTRGPYAWLKFHSDDTIEYEGFKISWNKLVDPASYSVPKDCFIELEVATFGVVSTDQIDQKCRDGSGNHGLDVLWTINTPVNTKIYLNFTEYELKNPNECDKNGIQIFGSVLELSVRLEFYCGSVANPVQTKDDPGNMMYVRLYTSKIATDTEHPKFEAKYTAYRTTDPSKDAESCDPDTEFDCADNTCIDKALRCDDYANCRLKTDEDVDQCKLEVGSPIKSPHILVILVIFSLILSAMMFVFLFKCFRKLYQDHKIIKEHIRQSCEDRLDRLDSLVGSRLTLDAKRLQRDSEPRASLERENHANEMFKRKRDSFSKRQPTSIDSDFQETHLDLDEEIWRREADAQIEPEDIRIERNGRTRRKDMSKKEESIRSKRESEERKRESEERKEIRDVSVGAPDTKESGCQTRESLFQTDPPISSDGSGSNSRGFSTFGYSGATIARPSPPTNTSELTIELLKHPPRQESVKPLKKIDRRPMSTETTRSAPDVIIVSKPIR